MPSTASRTRRISPKVQTPKEDILENDLEIKEVKPRSPRQKEIDVTKIIGGTITDKISATLAFGMSNNMLKSVGRDYAITPKEAYNIAHPGILIIQHYIPAATIKTKLDPAIANHVELILVTTAEYVTRILSVLVEKAFNKTLRQQGMVEQEQQIQHHSAPVQKSTPVVPQGTPQGYTVDATEEMIDNSDLPLEAMYANTGQPQPKQTSPGPTGFNFEELIADGSIVGDNGNNL